METKHTPGPWRLRDDETPWTEGDAQIAQQYGEPFGYTEILFSVAGEDTVAFCPWRPMDRAEDQEVLRANARLIAAAPDLLTALELMLDKDAAMTERFGDRWPLDLAPVHAVNAARAAIAKARGAE
jgi:hypothetical protein